ncbi:MAG: DUF4430 domain-containing protein [Clostridiales bacterium]|nr:DUF4430 domain-containing protein [Clostridiales bacterium]
MRRKRIAFILILAIILTSFSFTQDLTTVYGSESSQAEKSLLKAVEYYYTYENAKLNDWEELMAIYGSGDEITRWQLPDIPKVDPGSIKSYLPAIITSLIKGKNPKDLVEALLKKSDNGIFSNHADVQSLAMLGVEIASKAGIDFESNGYSGIEAATHLISLKDSEKDGFTGEYDGELITVDTTGYVALALAPYIYNEEVKTCIEDIVDFFEDEQLDNGGFNYRSVWEGTTYEYESANSTSIAVWGLIAIREESDEQKLNYRIDNIISKTVPALTKWQNEDGSFGTDSDGQGNFNSLTSRQVMIALYCIASESNIFNKIGLNEDELVSVYVRVESDKHLPIDERITVAKDKNTTVADAIELAKQKSGYTDEFNYEVYNFKLNSSLSSSSASIDLDSNEILMLDIYVTTRSAFETNYLSGEMNTPQTIKLINPETNEPLSGLAVTIDGSYVGYQYFEPYDPLETDITDINGMFTIPADKFLEAGEYIVSTSSAGISKDICVININPGSSDSKTVSVRVEGINENIVYEKDITVTSSGDKILTAQDALEKALYENNVDYSIYDSGYFWNFYINEGSAPVGIGSYVIEDGDEILVFYGKYGTLLPVVQYEYDEYLKVTIKDKASGDPIEGVAVSLNNSVTEVTDENGTVTFSGIGAGSYSLQVEKKDEDGLPLIVRLAPDYVINIYEETVVDNENEIIDLSSVPSSRPQSITVLKNGGIKVPSVLPEIKVDCSNANGVKLLIPAGTTVSGTDWDNVIELPKTESVSLPDKNVSKAIRVGSSNSLNFSKAVRLLFPGDGNKKVGFIDENNDFNEITEILPVDSGNALKGLEGKITVGDDLVVWTKHMTTFVTYTDKSSDPGGGTKKDTATIKVIGYKGRVILDTTSMEINNDTAYSILIKTGLDVEESGGYVSSIEGLAEKDYGPYSGWKYSVNGSYPSGSAKSYRLKDGDRVVWIYVLDVDEGEEGLKEELKELEEGSNIDAALKRFRDVKESDWFCEAVGYLTKLGIISGMTEDTFAPYNQITRAELAMILAKSSGIDLKEFSNLDSSFKDIDSSDWFNEAVLWAEEVGIVKGYKLSDGSFVFRPDSNITRQEMAVMIYNFINLKELDIEDKNIVEGFKDENEIADYAKEAVSVMQRKGIINGVKNQDGSYSFLPVNNASRAEAAAMIKAVIEHIEILQENEK